MKKENIYKVERLKFILQEISRLNDNTRFILTLYQSLLTAIVGLGIYIFVFWNDDKVDSNIAYVSINSLKYLIGVISLFTLFRLLANIISWIDFRKEEVAFLDAEIEIGFRKSPRLANFWRWDEFHISLLIIIITLLVFVFTNSQILPIIHE